LAVDYRFIESIHMDKQKLIDDLNQDLAGEFGAVIAR
jgi:hypothetical protein